MAITAVRRTSVEKFLTQKLKNRLRAEMADPKKKRERDDKDKRSSGGGKERGMVTR